MTIWLKLVAIAIFSLIASRSAAQELVKVPVQIPSISPAMSAFAIACERGYYRQEGVKKRGHSEFLGLTLCFTPIANSDG